MSENLARILTEAAEQSPDAIAFKLDDMELSYADARPGRARASRPP